MDHQALYRFSSQNKKLYTGYISIPGNKVYIDANVLRDRQIDYRFDEYCLKIDDFEYMPVDWLLTQELPEDIKNYLLHVQKAIPVKFDEDMSTIRKLYGEIATQKNSLC